MKYLFFMCVLFIFVSCKSSKNGVNTVDNSSQNVAKNIELKNGHQENYFVNSRGDTIQKVALSPIEWKSKLSEIEFYVLRNKGTERAFSDSELLNNKMEGLYVCRGCGLPLFKSSQKFDSGTGWPSFYDKIDKTCIQQATDYELGYPRTELTCSKCGGHLGHVFDDGPKPTGKRYCINAVSLDFVKAEY